MKENISRDQSSHINTYIFLSCQTRQGFPSLAQKHTTNGGRHTTANVSQGAIYRPETQLKTILFHLPITSTSSQSYGFTWVSAFAIAFLRHHQQTDMQTHLNECNYLIYKTGYMSGEHRMGVGMFLFQCLHYRRVLCLSLQILTRADVHI